MFIRAHNGRWPLITMAPDEGAGGGDGGGNDGGGEGAAAGKTFTQAELDRIVGERVGRERQKFADYDELKTKAQKLADIEAASQSDLERTTGERDTFKGRAETAEARLARYEAAAKAGLDIKHASRIQGSTPKEMEDDAKTLAQEFGAGGSGGGFDGGAREGGPTPTGGMDALIRRASGRTG